MSAEKNLTKNGLYFLVYNVLNLGFPIINGVYVSHVLLPEEIGSVSVAQNLMQYFITFSILGIPTYGLREIAKVRDNQKELNQVFSELFTINFISTVCFLIVYIGLISIVPTYRKDFFLYLVFALSIAFNIFDISWLFTGLEDFKYISIRNIVCKATAFLFLITLVKGSNDFFTYVFIVVLGDGSNKIANIFFVRNVVRFKAKNLNLKRHLRSIFYLVFVNLAIELYSLMDITMMNFMCSKDRIAFYKYAHQIQIMLLQVVNTITLVLVPRISIYYKEKNFQGFNSLVSKGLKLIIILSAPMIVGLFFTADSLIVMIYGDSFIATAHLLKIFSLLLLISPIGYLLGSRVLLATGHENLMIFAVGGGAAVNFVANWILIPKYYEFGATIASIIGEIVLMIIYVYMGKKHFKLEEIPITSIKVCVAVVLMGIFLFACSLLKIAPWFVLILQIIGAMFIYGLLLLLEKESIVFCYYNILRLKAMSFLHSRAHV